MRASRNRQRLTADANRLKVVALENWAWGYGRAGQRVTVLTLIQS